MSHHQPGSQPEHDHVVSPAAQSAAMRCCPKFEKCNAPLCPLDDSWRLRSHAVGDAVCGLALEAVKTGADARLAPYVRADVLGKVRSVLPEIMSRSYVIKRAVERAARSGSRLDNFAARAA